MSPTSGASESAGGGGDAPAGVGTTSAGANVGSPGTGLLAAINDTAAVTPIPPVGSSALSSIPTRTTLPDEIVRHDISDEELDVLSEGTKSFARDVLLMTTGALLGAAPGFFKAWDEVFSAEILEPMTHERLAALAIPLMAATAMVVTGLLLFANRKKGVAGLVSRIRARTQSRRL